MAIKSYSTVQVLCEAMYACYGKRRRYEDEVEERTSRIVFARRAVDIPMVIVEGGRGGGGASSITHTSAVSAEPGMISNQTRFGRECVHGSWGWISMHGWISMRYASAARNHRQPHPARDVIHRILRVRIMPETNGN
jgi:hypothetical protein